VAPQQRFGLVALRASPQRVAPVVEATSGLSIGAVNDADPIVLSGELAQPRH
jgi:hypothetical protein